MLDRLARDELIGDGANRVRRDGEADAVFPPESLSIWRSRR